MLINIVIFIFHISLHVAGHKQISPSHSFTSSFCFGRATPEIALAPMVAAPKWSKPSTPTKRGEHGVSTHILAKSIGETDFKVYDAEFYVHAALSESESDASYPVVPSPDATHKHE